MKNFFGTTKGKILIVVIVCLCVLAVFLAKNASEEKAAQTSIQPQISAEEGMPAFVEFGADWCTYCKQMQPILEELEQEYAGKLDFLYVDIDEDPQTAQQFGVTSVPYYVLLDSDGNVQATYSGATTKEKLEEFIQEGLGISA